ncbi:MAG: hypothetical protein KAR20_11160, partial [Candidatus Heimdallarchaeota archaeon]|nr:hypothetical protein [Candidatus Heimdallarchaeota archaeon]
EDTLNYKFRAIPKHFYKKSLNIIGFEFGAGKTLTGDDLERSIISKQRKIRAKQQKLRNKFSTLQNLLKEKIDIENARLVELQRHMALDLKIAEMETNIQKIRINTQADHQKQAIQERKIETVLNRNILEISGQLRSAWDVLPYLCKLWKTYQIPTLSLYMQNTKEWYHYEKMDSKALKKRWRGRNRDLKANLTQLIAPLLNQIKEDLAKIQLERKKKLEALSLESTTINHEIEANYNPFIKYLKKELRSTRIEKIKSFFHLKPKSQTALDQSPNETQGDTDNA